MFGMTVLILILPQFQTRSYKLRTHRNKIIRAFTLSLSFVPTKALLRLSHCSFYSTKTATILDVPITAAHTEAKNDFKPKLS
jgi:hypothetical protein